jgi:hypothetical protein
MTRITVLSVTVFLSLCFNCVCPYVTVFLLCASVVCIRTSPVLLISSSLSFFLWASVVGVRTRTSLYYCLFLILCQVRAYTDSLLYSDFAPAGTYDDSLRYSDFAPAAYTA